MDELQLFQGMGFEVRTIVRDGEPWFVAKDVCEMLEIINVSQAVSRLDDDDKLVYKIHTSGQNRDVSNENNGGNEQ